MELFGIFKVILWYCQENESKTFFMMTPRKKTHTRVFFVMKNKVVMENRKEEQE